MEQYRVEKLPYSMVHVLAWIYTCFIGFLAFDVEIISIGFLSHLLPFFILAVISLSALKNQKVAGILYLLVFLIFTFYFHTYQRIDLFLIISLPLLVIGVLFLKQEGRSKL